MSSMSASFITDTPSRTRVQRRQLSARLSEVAVQYLMSTPLARWQQSKLQLDEGVIVERAKARGLRLTRARAINSDYYELYDKSGKFLRRGSISAMHHFAEHYQG